LYGGVSHEEQIKDLKYGADIIISTTGRLLDFLKSKLVNLNMIETLIIDEADRLLEMGFEKQLNEIMNAHGNFICFIFFIIIKFIFI
jgi:superfamily II DNA/RNA helicase